MDSGVWLLMLLPPLDESIATTPDLTISFSIASPTGCLH